MNINTSPALSSSISQLSRNNIQVFRPDISLWKAPTAEEIARDKEEAAKQAAGLAEANDPAKIAAYKAVKAHTVVRVNGEIIAAVFRDGSSEYYKNSAFVGLDVAEYANKLPGPQGRDYIVNALMKKLGSGAVEERYGETGWAPNRGTIRKESGAFAY